jgi:hypothetical protein
MREALMKIMISFPIFIVPVRTLPVHTAFYIVKFFFKNNGIFRLSTFYFYTKHFENVISFLI